MAMSNKPHGNPEKNNNLAAKLKGTGEKPCAEMI